MTTRNTFEHPKMQRTIGGGYSGSLTVMAAAGRGESPVLVFIESELLGYLVLTPAEAAERARRSPKQRRREGAGASVGAVTWKKGMGAG